MSKASLMPVALEPAPPLLVAALYLLALVPVVGVVLLKLYELGARHRLVGRGRHMGALHIASHAKGALILGLVWSLAFAGRALLLDVLLALG